PEPEPANETQRCVLVHSNMTQENIYPLHGTSSTHTENDLDSFLSAEDTTSTLPATVTHTDLPTSCSDCKMALIDGEYVYQRKGHADIFCSTSCLVKFYQILPCSLRTITRPEDIIQGPVDSEETLKDFCSRSCLSSFNYKRIVSTKIPIVPVASHSQCSMCSRYCISKHEVIQQDVVQKICSNPCLLRFCALNNLSVCDNCCSPCKTSVMLKMKDGSKKLCSAECLAQFKEVMKSGLPTFEFKPRKSTAESSPVITNVISLATALSEHSRTSAESADHGSLSHTHSLSAQSVDVGGRVCFYTQTVSFLYSACS
uniref:TRASH domain-containing protein n=1 Tax=Mola mola TaxID=94237 RepID=A0A3Q3VLI0_MOLML